MMIEPVYALPQRRGARRGVGTVLVVAGIVLLVATAVLVVLFVNKKADTTEVKDRLAIAESQLSDATERADANESTMDTLETRHQELADDNVTLHACADPAKTLIVAINEGDRAALDTALDQMFANCGGN